MTTINDHCKSAFILRLFGDRSQTYSSSASKMPTVLGVEGRQCSDQRSAMKSPVHCGNPKDDRQNIDTCIPVVHALFFSLIDILSGGIPSFSIMIAETKSV